MQAKQLFLLSLLFLGTGLAASLTACAGTPNYTPTLGQNGRMIRAIQRRLPPDTPKPMRIAVVGDSQNGRAIYSRIAADIARAEVDFAVHLGDMTQRGGHAEVEDFLERSRALGVPYVAAVGNHDRYNAGILVYRLVFGASHYRFDAGGARFIVLDTSRREARLSWPTLRALRRAVEKFDGPVYVFLHIPPRSPKWPRGFEQNAAAFLDILSEPNIHLVFFGHHHRIDHGWLAGGTPYVQTGGGGGTLHAGHYHHWILLTVYETHAEWEIRAIDKGVASTTNSARFGRSP